MPLNVNRNKKRDTFTSLTLKGLLLFSIFTVLQGLETFESINRIWLVIVCCVLAGRLITYVYTAKEFLILLVTLILHVIAIVFTEFPLYNKNMLYYFLLWVLLYVYFAKSRERILFELEQAKAYINVVLWGWTILVGISAFMPSSYVGLYFFSFAGTSFRLMPSALIIAALAMYMAVKHENMRYNWFLVLPTYAAFMNQSRTYFGVFLLFLVMYLYICAKSKKNFYLLLIPCGIAASIMLIASGIGDKFEKVWYNDGSLEEFLGAFTNARTVFWEWDLQAFFDLPFWQQFVGNGFNFSFDVTAEYGNHAIWAHNDIINMLMNFGYIGTAIYLWAYFKLVHSFMPKGKHIPGVVMLLFQAAVFLNSMMNMSYTYFCAVISYPLFMCVINAKYCNCEDKK